MSTANIVWSCSDISNAIMAIPNLIAVLVLSGIIVKETRHYVYDNNLDEICADIIPSADEISVLASKNSRE